MNLFRDFSLSVLLSLIAYVVYSVLNIAQTHPIHQSLWDAETLQIYLQNYLTTPNPPNNKIFNEETATFNFGRYHHKLSVVDNHAVVDFSFPRSAFGNGGVIQKYLLLKEWSWTSITTEDMEWFCGTALSNVQTGSGFFIYCYNNNDGRFFHKSIENIEWHLMGFGWGSKFRTAPNEKRQTYINNGCIEWEDGELNKKHVASGTHCFNDKTGEYEVKVKMHGVSEKNIDGTEIGVPVSIELEYSTRIAATTTTESNDGVDEGMSHVFPLGPHKNNRAGLSTKYAATQARLHKLKIERKVTFERSYSEDPDERKRHKVEKVIADLPRKNNNNNQQQQHSLAMIDWTRSMFPRHTRWYWVAFAANLKSKRVVGDEKNEKGETVQLKVVQETADDEKSEGTKITRVGMQLTSLSYLTPGNFSAESVVWIDGKAFVIDSPVDVEVVQKLPSNNWIGGLVYKISFDMTKTDKNTKFQKQGKKDFFRLSMTFKKRAAHIQDFSLYKPVTDGALHHQIGEYNEGELTHFEKIDDNNNLKLKHVYKFDTVPGVFEDHDTYW